MSAPAGQMVLIIEDEPHVAQLIGLVLGRDGYQVAWRAGGSEGLEAARALHPAAIVLDLILSDSVQGTFVLRELRADPETSDIPVIISSAVTHRLTPEERAMAQVILTKPFGLNDLLDAIAVATSGNPALRPNNQH